MRVISHVGGSRKGWGDWPTRAQQRNVGQPCATWANSFGDSFGDGFGAGARRARLVLLCVRPFRGRTKRIQTRRAAFVLCDSFGAQNELKTVSFCAPNETTKRIEKAGGHGLASGSFGDDWAR